jgi:1-acyl-sn-glycerol-3-phosphate acyltransferase
MEIFRLQKPYQFCPPKYAPWFRPVLHLLCQWFLGHKFNIRQISITGEEPLVHLVKNGQSVLIAPNHADHADPSLLVHVGRKHGIAFHFMAAREGFERGALARFVLQRSGAFSVDREGADLASIKTAMNLLRACRYPLVIFPEGEIYHHHEALDVLNEGVATILLRAAEKLPDNKRSYAIPTAIRITHDAVVAETFSSRMDQLEQRITWKPKSDIDIVERIYRLGSALLSIKEEEFTGESQKGDLVQRIQGLQQFLVEEVERKYGLDHASDTIPFRIKILRQVIRKELTDTDKPPTQEREAALYDDQDRVFVAKQLYSYPGQYLRENPSIDRIAETILKLEEDILEKEIYPAPRQADITFGKPIDVADFLDTHHLNVKTGVGPMTELFRQRIQALMGR